MARGGFRTVKTDKNTRFVLDIKRFSKKALGRADAFVREVCFDIAEQIVERTPVDTGHAKNNWVTGINRVPAERGRRASKTGTDALNSLTQQVAKMKAGDMFRLRNYVPYIRRLEYGWSQKAPQGMVRVTLARIRSIASEALNRVNKL